jgi:methyl-accepting chemotaxis protein
VTARKFSCRSQHGFIGVLTAMILGLASTGGCTGASSDPESERLASLRSERAELTSRFHRVQDGIRRTQAAALDDPGVRAAQEHFYESLAATMREADPTAAGLLERARQIGADLDRVSGPVLTTPDKVDEVAATEAEREAVADELAAAERELRPHIERAMQDPEVRATFTALQDSVQATMQRIDPNAADAIARLKEISEQIRDLDGQIARMEGSR